ncbi:acyl-CoA hydrolase [Paenibacillus cellulosilyticus]|uniref:Acyl-CoA hydrolase n=1 Tax=Paenibacillus cellulosilyticus TaxID=375489 RepID=A0A2V2YRN9_9BACL|nr:acyl-CoA thioesterase [Paenibacillus cellulosilyticus]PWW00717.1 acyl-CoA hydrolase [Paenibacillus cellulosilyticus]QKS45574.1 acyl-CoA thioesterase [Paenibacillus cellulosilyticus]
MTEQAAQSLTPKRASDSRTVLTDIVFPSDTNHLQTLFGGVVMEYMDKVAAISAMRHSRTSVVTVSTDSIDFVAPIRVGEVIIVESFVSWTHRTSIEVYVKADTENLKTGERETAVTAFFVFVSLGEDGKPAAVPGVIPETDEEVTLYETGEERYLQRRKRMDDRKNKGH